MFCWETSLNNEQAHRDGKDIDSRPAHILFNLLSYQDKVRVMEKWKEALQGQSYFIVDTLQDWTEKETWKDKSRPSLKKRSISVSLRAVGDKAVVKSSHSKTAIDPFIKDLYLPSPKLLKVNGSSKRSLQPPSNLIVIK